VNKTVWHTWYTSFDYRYFCTIKKGGVACVAVNYSLSGKLPGSRTSTTINQQKGSTWYLYLYSCQEYRFSAVRRSLLPVGRELPVKQEYRKLWRNLRNNETTIRVPLRECIMKIYLSNAFLLPSIKRCNIFWTLSKLIGTGRTKCNKKRCLVRLPILLQRSFKFCLNHLSTYLYIYRSIHFGQSGVKFEERSSTTADTIREIWRCRQYDILLT
jgi:hypothetical protein